MNNVPLLLLVEDESLICMTLVAILEDGGFRVITAQDGAAAIAEIESEAGLAGIITDIRLGGDADGWDVARHARHRHPQIAVVYMTGDSAADWSAEGVPNSLMLQKPFASAQLLSAVSTLLNSVDTSLSPPAASDE